MRTEGKWIDRGGYIETEDPIGFDILINGLNRYLNFGDTSGFGGYGFRDNDGVLEFKNEGGAWTALGAGGGGGGIAVTFETINKNLESKDYTLNYTGDVLTTIVYDLPGSLTITKTFAYTGARLDTITLSGDLPVGLPTTIKNLAYTGDKLTAVTYTT